MRIVLIACLCAAPVAAVSAQHRADATPGPRDVAPLTASSATVPEANQRLLKVGFAGRRSVTGGVIGFVVGAAAGAFVGCLANRDDYGVLCGGQGDTKVLLGAAIGATAGALIGSRL